MTTAAPTTSNPTDRPTAASMQDVAGERRELRRAARVAASGVPLIAVGVVAAVLHATVAGVILTVLGALLIFVVGGGLFASSGPGPRAETRRRLAVEVAAHYAISELDASSLPTVPGYRHELTVRRGSEYLTVTATIPSPDSPLVLLGPDGRELPAA